MFCRRPSKKIQIQMQIESKSIIDRSRQSCKLHICHRSNTSPSLRSFPDHRLLPVSLSLLTPSHPPPSAAMSVSEKQSQALDFFRSNFVVQRIADVYTGFQDRREALGLSNPGKLEDIAKEVDRDVFLNNYSFTGLRAEITKMFSATPLFQISHALSMGSQVMPPYQFSALYGSPKIFCQGSIDNDLSLQGRFNWRWNSALITKTSVQMQRGAEQAMLQVENDYQGADFSANVKAINPSMLEGGLTGIFMGDYLQSITPKLALGVSAMWQRAAMTQGPETLVSYAARYKSSDWIASARLLGAGSIQASYWRRIAEKVEAGVDVSLQLVPAMAAPGMMAVGGKREGVATLGAKYEFRASTFRAQGDSQGRLACLLEKRVAPAVQVTFAGEIDHMKVQKFPGAKSYIMLITNRAKPKSVSRCKSKTPQKNSWSSSNKPVTCLLHHSKHHPHLRLDSHHSPSAPAIAAVDELEPRLLFSVLP